MATTDALTGLANRVRLRDVVNGLTDRSAHDPRPVAILLIDLDDFKPVNDRLGHEAGDELLVAFARILRREVRGGDLCARLGGDEFAVVLSDTPSATEASAVARRILDALGPPVPVSGQLIGIRASIGVAFSVDGAQTGDLMRQADVAMYEAKRGKSLGWCLYEPGMGEARQAQAQLEAELENALLDDELVVYYQPVVSLATGTASGVEALVRWQHPRDGLLTPAQFLPLAEGGDLIERIDAWVMRRAARDVRSWQQSLPAGRGLHLNVNFSPARLQRPDLVAEVLDELAAAGLDPHDLVLEVTETAVLEVGRAGPHLAQLRARGIRVALDDFGTGYSSLARLVQVPVDILKLDRCFVHDGHETGPSVAIAQAVAGLGRALGLDTVAEGIETAEQAEQMRVLGYAGAQGYHFSRPVPAAELTRWLTGERVRPAGP
ncbi:putative bifunctional diguanylate cyclase/phosphodiesterase [Kineosporia succinea]|uniref:Diguanylate cyclase (GGDEF)-like protein n=1 Tax=Kineosporia succinea TaxID=84632 RepID=A0ABT9PFG1_9ACTN|nr:bifunctional diguanylate cyclase/phosphodiesterase [Kineosporia succinea]MDP9831197.1 diguanylate cyclase (GGDEF)-like protein [Kineosporia succinea]